MTELLEKFKKFPAIYKGVAIHAPSQQKRVQTIVLFVISGIAFVPRFYNIQNQSMWYDEIITILVARLSFIDGLRFLVTDAAHPPPAQWSHGFG